MINGVYSKRCWVDGRLQEATVYFSGEKITSVNTGQPSSFDNILNAKDEVVMPGVIDAHVHVNEPGRTDWEGFDTATKAAAAGGITTIVDMPLNASPVTTTAKALDDKLQSTAGKLHVNVGFYGGIVPGNLNEMQALINKGVLGIKAFLTHSGIDEFPNVTEEDLHKVMPLLASNNIPLLVHCELTDEVHLDGLKEHPSSYLAYLQSRPKIWENNAVKLMIYLCKKHKCKVHIVHVSSDEALLFIKDAKAEGLSLTAETCPQYIYFNAEEIQGGQTIYKCSPPIREQLNNLELKNALKNNLLDFISSDHSPAPPSLKEIESGNLLKAWGGIAGLQFLLPASWSALNHLISLESFIPLVTEKPATFLSVDDRKGFLRNGYDADIVAWSPEGSFQVKEEMIFHRHKKSPYNGRQLQGVVQSTIVNGNLVFNNQNIIHKNKGEWLLRK